MIVIGVFSRSGRYPKPEPVIIKVQGYPELIAKTASSLPTKSDKNQ